MWGAIGVSLRVRENLQKKAKVLKWILGHWELKWSVHIKSIYRAPIMWRPNFTMWPFLCRVMTNLYITIENLRLHSHDNYYPVTSWALSKMRSRFLRLYLTMWCLLFNVVIEVQYFILKLLAPHFSKVKSLVYFYPTHKKLQESSFSKIFEMFKLSLHN